MTSVRRLRVLILADQCNPEWPSLPVVGYKYALALSELCDVVLATQVRNEPNIRKLHPEDTAALTFSFIDTEYVARPMHRVARVLRGGPEVAWSTEMAMSYLPYIEFERQVWKRFRTALGAQAFDIVHRVTPMSPALPSWMAGRARQPFVIGPLNGNLDWPAAFSVEQQREREGLRRVRNVYKKLPFARRTWREADCVLAAFQHTVDDLTSVPAARIVMFPEVGYDELIFYPPAGLGDDEGTCAGDASLTFLFAGRLVPYKLAEVAIRAFAGSPILVAGHRLRVVGDGPERERLEALVKVSGAGDSISLEGRLDQAGVAQAMRESDVFVFPSIRELGAGVVVEAMACGLLCVVVDYGGPADLVALERGRKVAMAPLDDLVLAFRTEMEDAAASAGGQAQLDVRRAAVSHVQQNFRWSIKAEQTVEIYRRLMDGRPVSAEPARANDDEELVWHVDPDSH